MAQTSTEYNRKYHERTRNMYDEVDALRSEVGHIMGERGMSVRQACPIIGVSYPVLHGFLKNEKYYPSTRIILRLQSFVERYM